MDIDKIRILCSGRGLHCPSDRSKVDAEVECRLGDETGDCIIDRRVYNITLDEAEDEVWDEVESCLMMMKLEEESVFLHKQSKRWYRVKLVGFEKDIEFWKMDISQRIDVSAHHKERGNALFKEGNVRSAIGRYCKALKYIVSISLDDPLPLEVSSRIKELKLQCLLNVSACHLKLQNHQFTVQTSTKALLIDSHSVKALYRRGLANAAMGHTEEAHHDLMEAKNLEPNNKAVCDEIIKLQRRRRESEAALKDTMKKMFSYN